MSELGMVLASLVVLYVAVLVWAARQERPEYYRNELGYLVPKRGVKRRGKVSRR